jgi:hypothetical protein
MAAQVIFALVGFSFHDQASQTVTVIGPHEPAAEQVSRHIQCVTLIEFALNNRHGVILLD